MSRRGSRQQKVHEVLNPRAVFPDDLKFKLMERDRLAALDDRTLSQRHFGDPPKWRSALAQRATVPEKPR
jgi:hypothetical protein